MDTNRYYANVVEVKEAMNPEQANDLLEMGWELLSVRQLVDSQTLPQGISTTTRVVYVLGKLR